MSRPLAWYEPRRGAFPWRADPQPYGVLVSEVMLQQTQVSRVVPAYLRFLEQFPTPAALAEAPLADVLRAWKGLGYNRRAAALWRAAGVIVAEHGGVVPSDPVALGKLPGIGPYTAAAVASFAFGAAIPAVDTNLRRVVARHRLGRATAPPAEVGRAAAAWIDRADPGAWNAALMDLGREVCRPEPLCSAAPLRRGCRFRAAGERRGAAAGSGPSGLDAPVRGRIVDAVRGGSSVNVVEIAPSGVSRTNGWRQPWRLWQARAWCGLAPGGRITLGTWKR